MTRALFAASCVGFATATGCRFFRSDDGGEVLTTRPSTTQQTWVSDQPLPQALQPTNRALAQSALPLMCLIETPGTLRVVNTESGEEILTFPARAMQVVRVEERGILLDGKVILGASLRQGVYALSRVSENELGTLHASQTIVRPNPALATRPAGVATPTPQ